MDLVLKCFEPQREYWQSFSVRYPLFFLRTSFLQRYPTEGTVDRLEPSSPIYPVYCVTSINSVLAELHQQYQHVQSFLLNTKY